MADPQPGAVLLDIEGTTTPIAFVHATLFPYARARLPALLRDRTDAPEVAAALETVPGPDRLATLLAWMDADAKETALKALQGLVWREGYEAGALHGALYPDVAPALRRWNAAGRQVWIYSSGSEEAQRLLFRHSSAGDLSTLITGYVDTRVGPKRAADSYRAILALIGARIGQNFRADRTLFLSDVAAELDAAAAAGLAVTQIVRPEDGTVACTRHPVAASLAHLL